MRPHAERSAEPIVCADVNVGLIEVSPSLVKACCTVKPPSGISGRFMRGISLERLLDDPRGGMDADDVEVVRSDVLELVRCFRAYHQDVARPRVDVPAVSGETPFSAAYDPGLGVRMPVQIRPLTGLVVDQEERDPGSVVLAFERQRAAGAALLVAGGNDLVHLPPLMACLTVARRVQKRERARKGPLTGES